MTDLVGAPAGTPVEVELKFRMSGTGPGLRLIAAEDLAGFTPRGPAVTVEHEDRYVDTPDGRLAAAGYAARFRTAGDETLVTLKSLHRGDVEGLHRRAELEGPGAPGTAPSEWPESAVRDAVLVLAGDLTLDDLVRIRQTRTRREFGRDDALVELSVDDVQVVAGDLVLERFAELELELRAGDEAALDPLADLLAEVEELVPAETSKLERALEALGHAAAEAADEPAPVGGAPGTPPGLTDLIPIAGMPPVAPPAEATPATPEPSTVGPAGPPHAVAHEVPVAELPRISVAKSPGVTAEDHLAEAGRKVLRFHLARMLAREPGTRLGRDSEELHAMRVATRRQRAAWRVFGSAFDLEATARHRRRLKEIAADLGAVRDLDVLIEAGEAYRDQQPPREAAAFDRLLGEWRVQREAARKVLLAALDSRRYRRWVDAYVAFVQTEGDGALPVEASHPHRVRDTMPSRIWAAYEVVRGYETVLRWADVTTLHELRIAAKWLRYTLEFVREALGPEAGPVIERVVALQDHLGGLHDADVAASLARHYLVERAGELTALESAAIGRYLVDRERELARLRRAVGGPWRGVSSLAFRRALGRLVAGL